MQVKDHNEFRRFDYNNYANPNFKLGEVVIKKTEENPIGVVIQTHDDGDCRTDQYGNVSTEEVKLASLKEIMQFRPELFDSLRIVHFDKYSFMDVDSGVLYSKETYEIVEHHNF